MDMIYSWVKNIAFYMILMTLLFQLLPGNSYHKYVRLFAGMIMIILVASPVMGFLNLDSDLESYFKDISLSGEAFELKAQLEQADENRFTAFFSEYKSGILQEVNYRAAAVGLTIKNAGVDIVEDLEDENFGRPTSFYLEVEDELKEDIIYIEPVIIAEGETEETAGTITKETEELKMTLMRLYNLPADKVVIIFKE